MKQVMIWLIRLYRKFISPIKPGCCRFTPTCSAYAIEAFEKRGFFAGFILTVWRILRCNPFGRGGYDPVPERGFRRVRIASEHTESSTVAEQNEIEAQIATDECRCVESGEGEPEADLADDIPSDMTEAQGAKDACGASDKEKEI